MRLDRVRDRVTVSVRDLLAVSETYKDVKEGGAVVVVQDLSLQLLLDPPVHLRQQTEEEPSDASWFRASLSLLLYL